jgi:hypothetical protein
MNRLAFLSAIALFAAGCASRSAIPAATAQAPRAQHAGTTPPSDATPPSPRVVELRHFYLLSPGPNTTLVVTRSDLAPKAVSSPATVSSSESSSAKQAAPFLLQ